MAHTYDWQTNYPWINFSFDFARLDYRTWMALGECSSMCAHIENIPLAPKEWSEMHRVYLAKGVLATTAIEGNTLSEEDARKAVEGTLKLPESKEYLGQEIQNILDVFNEIGHQIKSSTLPDISPELLCQYNEKVLRKLPLPDEVKPGTFRTCRVGVGPYRCPPAGDIPAMVGALCERLRAFDEMGIDATAGAILKAVMAHLYVAWIHPFGDGNGRTARLLEAMILLQQGIPSPASHLLSNHYNATRTQYYRVLDRASIANDPLAFVAYAIIGLRDGLREQRQKLMDKVWKVVWKNHIYKTFGQKQQTKPVHRQRELALALAKETSPVTISKIDRLNGEIAALYANKRSSATLRRDIHALLSDKLIREETIDRQTAYVTNIECLRFLLPLKREDKKE